MNGDAADTKILLLGGTREAAQLVRLLQGHEGLQVITSLAGRTQDPRPLSGLVRRGGFSGVTGLLDYLRDQNVDLVINATHPFAAQIGDHVMAACWEAGVPLLRLCRRAWTPQEGDNWIFAQNLDEAARLLEGLARRVFLTTGRQGLAAFSSLRRLFFLVRLVDPPEAKLPLPHYEVILGRGPFSLEEDLALLTEHRIDALIAKNSGGDATSAKLTAARQLGLPVVMIARPQSTRTAENQVADVETALAWLEEKGYLT